LGYYSLYDLREGIGLDRNDGHKDTILVSLGNKGDAKAGNNTSASNAWALMLYFAGPGNDIKKADFYRSLFEDSMASAAGGVIVRTQGYKTFPLNPDASQYRSTSGSNNSTDDSDLT